MKRSILTVIGFLLLLGCTTPEQTRRSIPLLTARSGEQVALDLTARYHETKIHCDDIDEVAHRCSGVIFRGTIFSSAFHVWNPNPIPAGRKNGVSFSYLREDAKFMKVAYGYKSGFILYPENQRPSDKNKLEVRCFFPLDAGSDLRIPDGCDQSTHAPYDSRVCQVVGVHNGEQWINRYRSISVVPPNWVQCAFDIREARGLAAATGFVQAIDAIKRLGAESFALQNELIITPWPQDVGDTLPIEAFFFDPLAKVEENEELNGLYQARGYQKDMYDTHGLVVPIIRLTLPATSNDEATFEYHPEDQLNLGAQP
jgi:hypothetical protein